MSHSATKGAFICRKLLSKPHFNILVWRRFCLAQGMHNLLQSFFWLGEQSALKTTPILSTGIPQLDTALGLGGLPSGRFIEIFGPPGCGKTTLALNIMRETQLRNHVACYIDCDHTLCEQHAIKIGLKTSETLIIRPAFNACLISIITHLLEFLRPKLIVVDSSSTSFMASASNPTLFFQKSRQPQKALLQLAHQCALQGTSVLFVLPLEDESEKTHSPHLFTNRTLKHYTAIRLALRVNARPSGHTQHQSFKQNHMRIHLLKNPFASTPLTISTEPIILF